MSDITIDEVEKWKGDIESWLRGTWNGVDGWWPIVDSMDDAIKRNRDRDPPRLPQDPDNDGDYILPPDGSAWIGIAGFGLYLKHSPDGIILEIYCEHKNKDRASERTYEYWWSWDEITCADCAEEIINGSN